MTLPQQVTIVEVGPRDGLQNEKVILPTKVKIDFIQKLADCGVKIIESTSFVSPKWVPQMQDHYEVIRGIHRQPGVVYPALIPNQKGMIAAMEAGIKDIALFTTTSETFSLKNANCTIEESFIRMQEVAQLAKASQISIRGYVSCAFACPYEGPTSPQQTVAVAQRLLDLGCNQVSFGDTIGIATPGDVQRLLDLLLIKVNPAQIAMHFHDTYGQALANIYLSLQYGIYTIDSSVAGLGGCPYAKSATGNVATEDVIYMLNGLNIVTGINLHQLIQVGQWICQQLDHPTRSKVSQAMTTKS